MKENYEAWDVKVEDFEKLHTEEEKIRFLINFAVLAPSSHNSQPWAFFVTSNSIKAFLDEDRKLEIGDENNRQAFLSIGCAIENIIVAADYYGYESLTTFNENERSVLIQFNKNNLANRSSGEGHLIWSIPRRTVNRSKYLDKQIDSSILQTVKNFSDENIEVHIITDKEIKNKLADVALTATSEAMTDKSFRKELSHHVISNNSKAKTGMPGFTIGFPTLVSYIAPLMLKIFNMSKLSNKQDEPLLKEATPYMLVLTSKQDDWKSWVGVGLVFQKISLLTVSKGISLALWAAPIQIKEYYKDVQKLLNTEFRPQMFFRMGYASKEMGGHSPRLTAEEVIKK